jgi:hypothetical protein
MSWHQTVALGLVAFMTSTAAVGPQSSHLNGGISRGDDHCPWSALRGNALLSRRIGPVNLTGAYLAEQVMPMLFKRNVPLSFVEDKKDLRITLQMADPTLQEVLESITHQAPTYKYEFVLDHLVLAPKSFQYQLPLENFSLPPTKRGKVAYLLVTELQRRYPAFSNMVSPGIFGNASHFIYQDLVEISGATNLLNALAQMLGSRPSAVFLIVYLQWGPPALQLDAVDSVTSLSVEPASAPLRVGEAMQLRVTATLVGGAKQDVTSSACRTTYASTQPKSAVADENGLLRALQPGEGEILVRSELQTGSVLFKVTAPTPSSSVP